MTFSVVHPTPNTISTIIAENENGLKKKIARNFSIHSEGLIDGVTAVNSLCIQYLQSQVTHLIKGFNQDIATAQILDNLFMRTGLSRQQAQPTRVSLKVIGIPNLKCESETIFLQNKNSYDYFYNTQAFITNEDGSVTTTFQCFANGNKSVLPTDEFTITQAPEGIIGVKLDDTDSIVTGKYQESDSAFRKRFDETLKTNRKSNRDGLFQHLSPLVDAPNHLQILDPLYDNSLPPGYVKIIAHHNTTDELFANAIYNAVAFGIHTLGNTTVNLTDCDGYPLEISFEKAEVVPIYIQADIKFKSGYFKNSLIPNIKNNILNYFQQHVYGLGDTIFASEFVIPILQIDGVEAVGNLQIKSDSDFVDQITLSGVQVPDCQADWIEINDY